MDSWFTTPEQLGHDALRCLVAFEPGVRRQRLMQRQRASRLEALHGALNPEHYLGMVRSNEQGFVDISHLQS